MGYSLKKLFKKPANDEALPFRQFNYLNLMAEQDLIELLQFSERNQIMELSTEIRDQRVLSFSNRWTSYLSPNLATHDPALLIDYVIDQSPAPQRSAVLRMQGGLASLALGSSLFDLVFYPMASRFHFDFSEYFGEVSRVLANNGRVIFSFAHPQLAYLLHNQNPAAQQKAQVSLEKYIQGMRENNLYLETLREVCVNKQTRPFFVGSGPHDPYEDFEGTPLVLFLRAVKYIKK